jgi:hypothetical protein
MTVMQQFKQQPQSVRIPFMASIPATRTITEQVPFFKALYIFISPEDL